MESSPVVDGDDFVSRGDELCVDGALDGIPHQCWPLLAAHCDRALVHGLELRTLTHLKHE